MGDINVELNVAAAGTAADIEPVEEAPVEAAVEESHEEALITSTAIENSKVEADVLETSKPQAVEEPTSVSDKRETEPPVITEEMISSLEKEPSISSATKVLDEAKDAERTKAPEISPTDASIIASAYVSGAVTPQKNGETALGTDTQSIVESTVLASGIQPAAEGEMVQRTDAQSIVKSTVLASGIQPHTAEETVQGTDTHSPKIKETEPRTPNEQSMQLQPDNYSPEALRYSAMAGASINPRHIEPSETENVPVKPQDSPGITEEDDDTRILQRDKRESRVRDDSETVVPQYRNDVPIYHQRESQVEAKAPETKLPETKNDPINYHKTDKQDPMEHFKETQADKASEKREEKREKIKTEGEKEAKSMNKTLSSNKPSNTGKASGKAGKVKNEPVKLVKDENGYWKAKRPQSLEFIAHDVYMNDAKAEFLRNNPEPTLASHTENLSVLNDDVENTEKSSDNYDKELANTKDANNETYFSKYSKWKFDYNKHMKALEKDYQAQNKAYKEQYNAYKKAQLKADELNKRLK